MSIEPGQLVSIATGCTVRVHGTETERWVTAPEMGLVIRQSHLWHEGAHDGDVEATYIVLFSSDNRLYLVPGSFLRHPDQARDPGRLFGRLLE